MKKITIVLFLCFCAVLPAAAQGIKFAEDPVWKETLALAAKENKLIFMDCYTTWCGPCKELAAKIFPLPEVGEFFNANFINVKYDMEKGEGIELNKHYKPYIVGYPTMLLIDKDGNVVQQIAGYKEGDVLIANMKAALEGNSLFTLKEKYESGNRDVNLITKYTAALEAAFLKEEAASVVNAYMKSLPLDSLLTAENWEIVNKQITDPYSPQFEHLLKNLTRFVYKPYVDAFNLERQLSRAIDRAISDITKLKKDKDENILPYSDERENINRLRTLMNMTDLRRLETQRANLLIHELQLDEKWQEVISGIEHYSKIGAASNIFTGDVIMYLATRTKDKAVLNKGLAIMENIQRAEEAKSFSFNYHNVIAALYSALGDKTNAEKSQAIYSEYLKKRQDEFRALMNRANNSE